jgi:hypothetical protein
MDQIWTFNLANIYDIRYVSFYFLTCFPFMLYLISGIGHLLGNYVYIANEDINGVSIVDATTGRCNIIIGVVSVYMEYNCVYYCDTCVPKREHNRSV